MILIVADDLGWKDVGFMGSKYYETPNLDMLAKKSVIFRQAYANASNCAPSRACLITGLLTPRHGIYTVESSERGQSQTRKIIPTPNRTDLDPSFPTFPKLFQNAGFKTALIGKWHLSDDPRPYGFDIHIGGGHAGSPKTYFSPYQLKFLTDGPKGEELTDRLTTEAMNFIAKSKKEPFLLYLPYFAVHTPLEGKAALVQKYQKRSPVDGQGGNAKYAALVENMDMNVGRILSSIDSLKLENVMVIFTSDNGGIASISRQWPLRAGKGSYYEGGVRVPLLIFDKSSEAGARVIETPVQLADLYPTLIERAKIKPDPKTNLDGVSLVQLLKGQPQDNLVDRPFFWHFPIYLESYQGIKDDSADELFRTRPGSALRVGQWKMIEYFENDMHELYDLENDPGERINLFEKGDAKSKWMLEQLHQWQSKLNAPVPKTPNRAYDPAFRSSAN